MKIFGVDFGAKNRSSTVISTVRGKSVILSRNIGDADTFILDYFKEATEGVVFIDAPLSLPKIYKTGKGTDFFLRSCDRELRAMSPMFLGGLTARAMKIRASLSKQGLDVYETYPSALARHLGIDRGSARDISNAMGLKLPKIKDRHEFDSILCLLSAKRFLQGSAVSFGDNREGVILI